MGGCRIGYVRVSSPDQNPERQLEQSELDKVFIDKASAKDVKRPQLDALLSYAREGDTVMVHSMDRLARNLIDLRQIVQALTEKGVCVVFVKENLTFTGDSEPISLLLLSIIGSFAEFERALIRERQRQGIELAKKRGAYRGGKRQLTPDEVRELKARAALGVSKARLARTFNLTPQSIYNYLKRDDGESDK